MARVLMFVCEDHLGHAIIDRQLRLFLSAGYRVDVVQASASTHGAMGMDYGVVAAPVAESGLLRRWLWRVLRRLLTPPQAEKYWAFVAIAERLRWAASCARLVTMPKPDVLWAHDLPSLVASLLMRGRQRIPVVYDAHELASEQGDPGSAYNGHLRRLEGVCVPRADAVIAPNKWRAMWYVERYKLRAEPLVVRNCYPLTDVPKANRIRETLGLSPAVHIVLYHGALIPGRALDNLIRAVEFFEPGICLVVVGTQNAYYGSTLRPLTDDLGLASRVFFLPYVPHNEVMSVVASADLGVVIYKNTNQNNYLCAPTKLYEFIMARVPVVGCAFPEVLETLAAYPVGLTFDPDDPLSIAAAVNSACRGNLLASASSHFELARQTLNYQNESRVLLSLLAELCPATAYAGMLAG